MSDPGRSVLFPVGRWVLVAALLPLAGCGSQATPEASLVLPDTAAGVPDWGTADRGSPGDVAADAARTNDTTGPDAGPDTAPDAASDALSPPDAAGAPCSSDADCTDPGLPHCLPGKGVCVQCAKPVHCDDMNACTVEYCTQSHECLNTPLGGPCSDGDPCTEKDHCADGQCTGTPVSCADGDPCTSDACVPGQGCTHAAAVGAVCDDNDACTTMDTCNAAGVCAGVPAPCEDGDPCTVGDVCLGGTCTAGAPASCDDGDACTTDSCVPKTGCKNVPSPGAACDDQQPCTVNDVCLPDGKCAGVPDPCSDGNPCTVDSCVPFVGCKNAGQPGLPCDDANACTYADSCNSLGVCAGVYKACSDTNPCTKDTCDPASGCVFEKLDGKECSDGDPCTAADSCKAGVCAGSPLECGDEDPCTTDYCNAGACVNQPIPGCAGGSCVGHCGAQSGDCWCDDGCASTNDCCPDACTACPFLSHCECAPQCTGKECGADGCSGSCGTCLQGLYCAPSGKCKECSCGEKKCGQDQCGKSCGTCPVGKACVVGQCL